MLLSLVKRRWPVLTTVVAGLFYLVNNYDIRGLDALRLEPRAAGGLAHSGWSDTSGPWNDVGGGAGGWNASLPAGPRLGAPLPSTSQLPGLTPAATAAAPLPGLSPASPSPASPSPNWPAAAMTVSTPPSLSVGEKLAMLEQAQEPAGASSAGQLTRTDRNWIRIASFNAWGWGDAKRENVAVARLLARLLGQFDLIALQDIRSRQDDLLPELVRLLNSGSRRYDFMIGPRVGRGEHREQLAFVFDTERIETDRFQLYTVEDPEDMLSREPLVGWFRTTGVPSDEAFTFSLVNVHIDPDLVSSELKALPSLVQAIANDGRGEDDIVLAGDFSAAPAQLEMLTGQGIRVLLEGVASTTRGTHLLDNIVFPPSATTEYSGRSGAFDFLRQFNLSLEQAVEVSEHLPIWAEFSIIEGGRPGQVAGIGPADRRFTGGVN